MRGFLVCLIALLVLCPAGRAQRAKPAPVQHDQSQNQRPTLGPPTRSPSSPAGPPTSTTSDPSKLLRIRKLFVEDIDNRLSGKLMEDLGKMGRFRIVADKKEADAVLRGTCFDSRRLKTLHSEVFINDRATGASIWQDDVHRPFNPPVLQNAVDGTATLIIQHLTVDLERAEHR